MRVEVARFRSSAKNCRKLAKEARDETSRRELYHLAAELEIEADRIDEGRLPRKLGSPRRSQFS